MSAYDIDPVSKLAKLNKSDDYILWKRRVFAYIRRNDAELVGFDTEPSSNAPAIRKKWFELMIRARSTIVLCLGDSPLAKVRNLVDDDDSTAIVLWDELEKIYTASNAQAILNLRQEMDELRYEEDKSWDDHVNKFTELLSKLATYDEELTDKDKASKLLRSLPESFSGFAMIAQVQDLEVERLIQAMHAEISRRASLRPPTSRNAEPSLPIAANATKSLTKTKKKGNFAGCKGKNNPNGCYICGKNGHFARECWYRFNSNRGRGRGRPGYSRGHRGRGRGGYYRHHSQASNIPHYGYQTNRGNAFENSGNFNFSPFPSYTLPQNQTPQANFQLLGNQGTERPPSTQNTDPNIPFRGFMAQIKRSKLASINATKTDDALIDSGATHFFFHSIKYFSTYKKIEKEDVLSASGVSRIVGIGQVLIPINGGIYFEAYHAPQFGENILSVSKLSRFFKIEFSSDESGERSFCCITSKRTGKLVFRTDEIEGLYKMSVPKRIPDSTPTPGIFHALLNESSNLACIVYSAAVTALNNNYRRTSILHDNQPLQWHFRTGHPNPNRYSRLAQTFPDVPYFPRSTLDQLFCIPCQQGKTRRAAVLPTPNNVSMPLELVHTDISGPVLPSLSGSIYSLAFMDSKTAKSDVFFLKKKSELATCLMSYKAQSELQTGHRLQKMRLDGAGENMSRTVKMFCLQNGIRLDPSPPYAHQSNGTAERLIQELWARTRVLLFASQLPAQLWAEAMNHANWLRNRLRSTRIQNQIPILMWNPTTSIQFSKVPVFGQPGFAFKYRADTVPNKKFLARSVHAHFVGMESDATLLRVYVPETKSIMLTRAQDFRSYENEKLPGIASILDGLAKQTEIEGIENTDGQAEDVLMKAFNIFCPTPLPQRIHRIKPGNQSLLRSSKTNS